MPPSTVPASPVRSRSDETSTSSTRHVRHSTKNLLRKRPESMRPTAHFPAQLQDTDNDSAEEDLTAANKGTVNMAQSIFGLVAAVGSTGNFNQPFQDQSSDDENDDSQPLAKTAILPGQSESAPHKSQSSTTSSPSHRRKISDSRLFKSISAIPRFRKNTPSSSSSSSSSKSKKHTNDPPPNQSAASAACASSSPSTESDSNDADIDAEPAPVMSRILDGRAEMAARPSFDLEAMMCSPQSPTQTGDAPASPSIPGLDGALSVTSASSSTLARKLKDIFEFDEPEEVIKEYPCWLLQSVLLQGFMYITTRHICFYAYLPKKTDKVIKAGFLGKSGRRNPKYHRYHFRLKGHQLTYHETPTDLYFQSGLIDLSYGISAMITDKDKDGTHFNVVTHERTFHFKADSPASARDWVHSLQRVIFRSHNDGDSVKISLPVGNVIDVEDTQMLDFAETVKIRVIDNDDTFAIDEYFFSFFRNSTEALDLLRVFCEKAQSKNKEALDKADSQSSSAGAAATATAATAAVSAPASLPASGMQSPESGGSRAPTPGGRRHKQQQQSLSIRTTKLPEPVKATLSPMLSTSPRASVDGHRPSFDALRQVGLRSGDFQSAFADVPTRRSFSQSRSRRSASGQRAHHADHRRQVSNAASTTDMASTADVASTTDMASAVDMKASSDSYVRSLSVDESSMAMMSSVGDHSIINPSATASQILHDSDVFHSIPGKSPQSATFDHKDDKGDDADDLRAKTAVSNPESESESAAPALQLQGIARIGSLPLQRAGALADYLNRTSRKMSSLLATESMGYVEKVSGMWKGGRKHYQMEPNSPGRPNVGGGGSGSGIGMGGVGEGVREVDEDKIGSSNERFRAHFGLPETESLKATYFCYMMRVLPLYGKIYVSDHMFCFRSLLPGTRTKLILPLKDVETADKEKGFRFGYSGLVLVIRGHEELFFEFGQAEVRDDCHVLIEGCLEASKLQRSGCLDSEEEELARNALAERDALQAERGDSGDGAEPGQPEIVSAGQPKSALLPPSLKPHTSLRITCLTIGSRGDVQPYIALCKGLLAEGHRPKIVTHAEFGPWVESHGIGFAAISGDPAELMRLCIDNGMFTWTFLREATSMFRGWLDDLFASAWRGCQDSDVLIESPSAMAGIHIAEALEIPYFRAFTMPWTRTRAYPHAFAVPEHKMGGAYNYMTYVMFDNLFWKAIAYQVNRWRTTMLKLPSTTLEKLQANKVPFLYNFSPSVVAPPLDFSDWIRVTGYWFLDEGSSSNSGAGGSGWTPPADLQAFIDRARADGKKLVYVGFGSILVNDPGRMTQEVVDAVLGADVRCVLSKGWSERKTDSQAAAGGGGGHKTPEPEIPDDIFVIKSAPHDWLFAQMDAAAHHGGSGTTGASLRAGIPTIIRPFFGDQFFFGSRVEDIGVGVCLKKWGAKSFGRALWTATRDERMRRKAAALGRSIRSEHGVASAIQSLYRDMEYARGLVLAKTRKTAAGRADGAHDDEDEAEAEVEEWTFIGTDEPDPEVVTQRLSEM